MAVVSEQRRRPVCARIHQAKVEFKVVDEAPGLYIGRQLTSEPAHSVEVTWLRHLGSLGNPITDLSWKGMRRVSGENNCVVSKGQPC